MKYLLKDICNISAGGDVPKGHYSLTKSSIYSVPIYSNGIENEGLYGYTDKAAITDEAITISARGTIGITFRRTKPYYPIVRLISLIPKKSDINLDYLYYALKLYRFKKDGSVQQQLTVPMVGVCEVDLPDLPTQKRIASVLSNIDRKIALNRAMNEELEQTARDLYDYWFLQFDFPDANGKPYRSSGGKMVYNPQLKREIPEGWEVKNIFSAVNVLYGYPFATEFFAKAETIVPVVRIRDILEGKTSAYSTEVVDDKYLLKEGDVLIGMDGNFHMNYWHTHTDYLNQRCLRLRPYAESSVSSLQVLFETMPIIKAREKSIKGSTVAHLSDKDIKSMYIVVPKETETFLPRKHFDAIMQQSISNRNEILHLTSLRNELLPLLMNGQVTIE